MGESPLVSVVMANFNGAAHIGEAVQSVLGQSIRELELLIADDGSTDDSLARAMEAAKGDPRLRLVPHGGKAASGPAAARNRALDLAQGRWIAIVDNDDFITPDRLQRLVAAAERDGADIAADDMRVFYESGAPAHNHLSGALAREPVWISAEAYMRANALFASAPSLGYLKPIIRRSRLALVRYDERLRIAEDFDLVMRLLLGGARMRTYPEVGYHYRKHARSISHRLSQANIDAMIAAHDRLANPLTLQGDLRASFGARRRSLTDARAFDELITALKARNGKAALKVALKAPGALWLLHLPLRERLKRLVPPRAA